MTGVTEKTISRSVTEYNKNLSNQCNLSAQIEQVHDSTELMRHRNHSNKHSIFFFISKIFLMEFYNLWKINIKNVKQTHYWCFSFSTSKLSKCQSLLTFGNEHPSSINFANQSRIIFFWLHVNNYYLLTTC